MKLVHLPPVKLPRTGQTRQLRIRARGNIEPSLSTFVPRGHPVKRFFHPWLRNSQLTPLPRFRTFSTPPTTLVDPSRPSLFYHLLPTPNPISTDFPAYAVSLLDRPTKDAQSPAIMGWLPAAVSDEAGEEAGLGDFKENPEFLNVLHQVIHKAIEDGNDERLNAEAMQLGEGWMHINDDRRLPEMGRINSPDDIIASVRVEGGEMLPDTYSPMPTYRICTTDGLTTLSHGLNQRLLDVLCQIGSH